MRKLNISVYYFEELISVFLSDMKIIKIINMLSFCIEKVFHTG
jgi:hypothetical protein